MMWKMNKTLYIFVAVVGLCLVSCSKQAIVPNTVTTPEDGGQPMWRASTTTVVTDDSDSDDVIVDPNTNSSGKGGNNPNKNN
jgi:hypothetical protein